MWVGAPGLSELGEVGMGVFRLIEGTAESDGKPGAQCGMNSRGWRARNWSLWV